MAAVATDRPAANAGEEDGGLSVALSGGGYRSALFGLGALHYLYSSGEIERLRTITSVSGGSYTNARAMLLRNASGPQASSGDEAIDTREVGEVAFRHHFQPFVRAMTDGSPFRSVRVLSLTGLMAFLVALSAVNHHAIDMFRRRMMGRWHWMVRVLAAGSWIALVPSWGRQLASAIWSRLFGDVPRDEPLGFARRDRVTSVSESGRVLHRNVGKDILAEPSKRVLRKVVDRMDSSPASPPNPGPTAAASDDEVERATDESVLRHVFSATDLQHGVFLYLSDDFVFSPVLGFGSPAEFDLKDAIDASAAIPPIFAPVRIDTRGFTLLPPDAPGFLLCADGGLHDTLAVEWFSEGDEASVSRTLSERYANEIARLCVSGDVLVVDGSAPVRGRSYLKWTTVPMIRTMIPIAWWMVSHVRSIMLAMSNWDRRNFEQLSEDPTDGLIGVSIKDTPFVEIDGESRSKAQAERLARLDVDWRALVRENGSIPTRPHQLTVDQATKLMYHGYVMAWAALAHDDPPELPTLEQYREDWFVE